METIVISRSPNLPGNLDGLRDGPKVIRNLVEALFQFQNDLKVVVVNFYRDQSAIEFIEGSNTIPNSDATKQLHFESDTVRDCRVFTVWIKNQIAERDGCKLAGIQLTETAFKEMLQIDTELVLSVIKAKRELDSFLFSLPSDRVCLEYIYLEKGQVKTRPNAEQDITKRCTTFATESQMKFLAEINTILNKIAELEKSHSVGGLLLTAVTRTNGKYEFDATHLNAVK